jgi:hypothetical protein
MYADREQYMKMDEQRLVYLDYASFRVWVLYIISPPVSSFCGFLIS